MTDESEAPATRFRLSLLTGIYSALCRREGVLIAISASTDSSVQFHTGDLSDWWKMQT